MKILAFLLFVLVSGCAGTNHYTKDLIPTVHLRGSGADQYGHRTVYLTISNPTTDRIHFEVDCGGIKQVVAVAARSDRRVFSYLPFNGTGCAISRTSKPEA